MAHKKDISNLLPPTWADIKKRFIDECCELSEEGNSHEKEIVCRIKSDSPHEMLRWWKKIINLIPDINGGLRSKLV